MSEAVRTTALSSRQIVISAAYGVALWFGAATLLCAGANAGIYEGWVRVAVYALAVPAFIPFVLLIRPLARLDRRDVAIGVMIATAAATLCDGIALGWFPGLYGTDPAHTAGAGAAILWGVGVGLVEAMVVSRSH